MIRQKLLLITLTLLSFMSILSSCEQSVKEQIGNLVDAGSKDTTVKVNEYQLTVPTYLKRVTNLNEEASLQFQNIFKDTYLIVIDESKDTLVSTYQDLGAYNDDSSVVKNYRDIQLEHIKENLKILNQSAFRASKINGYAAETVEVDGEIADLKEPISYIYTFIEGPDRVYMIMTATLKDRKEKHRDMFLKIINSFKIVKP